jgi:AcrR family transcriptional regulator
MSGRDSSKAVNAASPKAVRRRPESLSKLRLAARKLFVERGYHATRPQDIAREAGLGHGTFYLHFPDKRACFLAFVEEARAELDSYVRERTPATSSLRALIESLLNAIYDYSESHPGVLNAAMTDEAVIDAEGDPSIPLLQRWGYDWAAFVRDNVSEGRMAKGYSSDIVGQAILGAVHQASSEGWRAGRSRAEVVDNLSRFLVRALEP